MKRNRLKISREDFETLQGLVFADFPREAGAFLLAGVAHHDWGTDVLVRRVIPVPKTEFSVQKTNHLKVSSRAINGLAALCEANGLGVTLCHSHPTKSPYSPSDDYGELRVFRALREFLCSGAPTASLLLYPGGITGRVWSRDLTTVLPLDEIQVIGRNLETLSSGDDQAPDCIEEKYSRQTLAFGTTGQRRISSTRVAIIGVGGTGSATAEQLARLGVHDILLVDPDKLERSNLSRVYGSFHNHVHRFSWWPLLRDPFKVEVLARHLRRISPTMRVRFVQLSIVQQEAAHMLRDRDVIFLCTDDHWGRSIVNDVSYQYLIPVINLGTRIDSKNGTIVGISGMVDVLRPDLPCLWCKQFLQADRISTESLPADQRSKLRAEGYVDDVDTPAPSVISLNTVIAGLAVTQFLQLVTDFMGEAGSVSRLNYDAMTGEVRRGTTQVDTRCPCVEGKGKGDLRQLSAVLT